MKETSPWVKKRLTLMLGAAMTLAIGAAAIGTG
jgi:hypothetical protein